MSKPRFYIYTLPINKTSPTPVTDIKLPGEMTHVNGLMFNVSKKYTDGKQVRNIGEISISLDNGISTVISRVEIKNNEHLTHNIITLSEPLVKNSFARVLYKDLAHADVENNYKVKIYFLYQK